MNKFCTGCKTDRPIAEFGVDKAKPSGRRTRCRSCTKEAEAAATRRYYQRNSEAIQAAHDHFPVPVARAGDHTLDNVKPSCRPCSVIDHVVGVEIPEHRKVKSR